MQSYRVKFAPIAARVVSAAALSLAIAASIGATQSHAQAKP